jgi:hypothetical protein
MRGRKSIVELLLHTDGMQFTTARYLFDSTMARVFASYRISPAHLHPTATR